MRATHSHNVKSVACKSCGADVVWAQYQKSGKRSPFDVESVPKGTRGAFALHEEGREVLAIPPADHDTEVFVSHFSTCPQSVGWRKS